MKCKAVQVNAPNNWQFKEIDLPQDGGELVNVHYSSLCHTDCQIIDGSLNYYQDGSAKYPIIPGHEWCGSLGGQPVVGLCIIGCKKCKMCQKGRESCCLNRIEVGVVNKNGGFADYIWIETNSLVAIPELIPKYAYTEPIAVVIHGLNRLTKPLLSYDGILISGLGTIGKFCLELCINYGAYPVVLDPRTSMDANPCDFELLIECSGNENSLNSLKTTRGQTVLAFGFAYNKIEPGIFVANEIEFIGSLGSNREDFIKAVDFLNNIEAPITNFAPLSEFKKGLALIKQHRKTTFFHGDL